MKRLFATLFIFGLLVIIGAAETTKHPHFVSVVLFGLGLCLLGLKGIKKCKS